MQKRNFPVIKIHISVLARMTAHFQKRDIEQGCLIGSSQYLNEVDQFIPIPGMADKEYFIPEINTANENIAHWMEEGICFCGFIHSHPNGAGFLSQADRLAIESWVLAANLPFLCFGVVDGTGFLKLYLAYQEETRNVRIKQMIRIADSEDSQYAQWRIKHEKIFCK